MIVDIPPKHLTDHSFAKNSETKMPCFDSDGDKKIIMTSESVMEESVAPTAETTLNSSDTSAVNADGGESVNSSEYSFTGKLALWPDWKKRCSKERPCVKHRHQWRSGTHPFAEHNKQKITTSTSDFSAGAWKQVLRAPVFDVYNIVERAGGEWDLKMDGKVDSDYDESFDPFEIQESEKMSVNSVLNPNLGPEQTPGKPIDETKLSPPAKGHEENVLPGDIIVSAPSEFQTLELRNCFEILS